MATLRDHLVAKGTGSVPDVKADDFPPDDGVEMPLSPAAKTFVPVMQTIAAASDRTVLVAGCLPSNIGEGDILKHPKLLLWTSDQQGRWEGKPIPKGVGAVLLLRFIRHAASDSLMKQARARGIPINVLRSGDVRQLLDIALKPAILDVKAEPAPAKLPNGWTRPETVKSEPVTLEIATPAPAAPEVRAAAEAALDRAPRPEPGKRKPYSSGLTDFLYGIGANPKAKVLVEEAKRLMPRVREQYPHLDEMRIVSRLSAMRVKGMVARAEVEARTAEAKAARPAVATRLADTSAAAPRVDPEAVAAAVGAVEVKKPEPDVSMQLTAALTMVDAALAKVDDVREALHVSRAALVNAQADLHDTILKQVQDEVLEALINLRAKKP